MPRRYTALAAAHLTMAALSASASAQGLTTLHSFAGTDGANPQAALLAYNGLYYGTTYAGGSASHGAIFSLDPTTGTETILYSFAGAPDGAAPVSPLVLHHGALYGTTSAGGTAGDGTIYRFDPVAKTEATLHSFTGLDGTSPQGAVAIVGSSLYGGTYSGGTDKYYGTIYKTNLTTGRTKVLHSFTGGADGETAAGGLLNDAGTIYGTALGGGATGNGTLFAISSTSGAFTVVYNFAAATGGNPQGGLLLHKSKLYGTAYGGGATGNGCVFQFNPATARETDLYDFAGGSDGALPRSTPIFHAGALYGVTTAGGSPDHGTVFKLVP